MNRSKLFKALRIAWAVGWGTVAVLLCVLWVRSYWSWDSCRGYFGQTILDVQSLRGELGVLHMDMESPPVPFRWEVNSDDEGSSLVGCPPPSIIGFGWRRISTLDTSIVFPHWFPILVLAMLATAPWLPLWSKRFSLRTLLIAMTLIAVALGLIVWATKR